MQLLHRHQRGTSLVEALIAFLVLSLGVLAMSKLQSHLRLSADIARQRSEAVRLAQQDIEASRSIPGLEGGHAASDIAPNANRAANTSFHLAHTVLEGRGIHTASVTVDWPDRAGHAQRIALHSMIAATPPDLSGALTLARNSPPLRPMLGRSALIPVAAKDLGNGNSALKPTSTGTLVVVFDNASGLVTSRCELPAGTRTGDLNATGLIDCTPMKGLLLSGTVRFSLASPPDANRPTDASAALDMAVAFSGTAKPDTSICVTDQQARAVAYHCVIAPAGRWSGRSTVVPRGWTIGLGAADRKVCRYSGDQDASGAIDSNAEHPDEYKDVNRSLSQQNFLIVRGNEPCPVATRGESVFADISTVQHQP